jgi:hypothetical protein
MCQRSIICLMRRSTEAWPTGFRSLLTIIASLAGRSMESLEHSINFDVHEICQCRRSKRSDQALTMCELTSSNGSAF